MNRWGADFLLRHKFLDCNEARFAGEESKRELTLDCTNIYECVRGIEG